MSTISSFKSRENKHDVCRRKDCMKKSCEYTREEAMKIIVLKRKNEVIDKRAVEITWKCKNLLYWSRKNLKKNM